MCRAGLKYYLEVFSSLSAAQTHNVSINNFLKTSEPNMAVFLSTLPNAVRVRLVFYRLKLEADSLQYQN